jgi:hypothetical protein
VWRLSAVGAACSLRAAAGELVGEITIVDVDVDACDAAFKPCRARSAARERRLSTSRGRRSREREADRLRGGAHEAVLG